MAAEPWCECAVPRRACRAAVWEWPSCTTATAGWQRWCTTWHSRLLRRRWPAATPRSLLPRPPHALSHTHAARLLTPPVAGQLAKAQGVLENKDTPQQ